MVGMRTPSQARPGPFSIARLSRRSQRKNVEHRGVAGDVGRTHAGLAAMRRRGLRARHGAGLSRYVASLVLPSRPDARLIGHRECLFRVMKRRSKMSAATAAFPESSLGYHFAIP